MTEAAARRTRSARQPSTRATAADRRWNLIVLSLATVVLAGTTLVARDLLASLEVSIFRAVNDLPQGLYTVVWPFMQFGTFITIPVLVGGSRSGGSDSSRRSTRGSRTASATRPDTPPLRRR